MTECRLSEIIYQITQIENKLDMLLQLSKENNRYKELYGEITEELLND